MMTMRELNKLWCGCLVLLPVFCLFLLPLSTVVAGQEKGDGICSETAYLAFKACGKDRGDDFIIARANCLNILDDDVRAECYEAAKEERMEKAEECEEVYDARTDLCGRLGEAAYDVSSFWAAENFVDPLQIGGPVPANPYFPLLPGVKTYEGGDETITVTVLTATKLINGVTCVTVNDIVEEDGVAVEDTDDWYAQDINGNVWYCGEISKNFEFFAGDVPAAAELVDLEGSWKAFRDMAQPGILMKAAPQVGDIYRQEMALSEAEDIAEVIANTANGMLPGDFCEEGGAEIAEFIAQTCNSDCLVTNEFTPLEPGHAEHKYYAPGTGLILETNADGECVVPQGVI